jgi:hypothetical protein
MGHRAFRIILTLVVLVLVFGTRFQAISRSQEPYPLDQRQFSVLGCGPWTDDPVQIGEDDPIVFPGEPGVSHQHQFAGATGNALDDDNGRSDANSTYGSLIGGGTDCYYSPDTAGYWFPTLKKSDGTTVHARMLNAYYRNVPTTGQAVAFPPDLRIVVPASVGPSLQGYNCGGDEPPPWSEDMVDCPGGIMNGNIKFPQCWDGFRIDSPDHFSHMAYAVGGACPEAHPVRVPQLSVHIQWPVANAASAGYELSSGPDTSLHADFWNVWDQRVLQELIEICFHLGLDHRDSNADPSCKDLRDS